MSARLRAADTDREAVAATLRRAHAEGRLDASELEERLGRCYAARTVGELDRLVDDLPRPRERRRRGPGPFAVAPLALAVLAIALVVASHGHAFFVLPLLFFVLLRFGRRSPRWR